MTSPIGTVYLLHFTDIEGRDAAFRHAKHYLGFSTNLPARLLAHESGAGARLTEVAYSAGIRWVLARTWPGVTREYERALKQRHGGGRMCPACGITPKPWPPSPEWTGVPTRFGMALFAECRRCHQRKSSFEFDLTGRTRRLCLACLDAADQLHGAARPQSTTLSTLTIGAAA